MGFPTFAAELINAIPQSIRIKSFSKKTLERLALLNKYCDELVFYHPMHLEKEEHRKRLTKSVKVLDSKKFREDIHRYRRETQTLKSYAFNTALQKFMDEFPWQKMQDNKVRGHQYIQLHKFWELTKETSRLSSEALMIRANQILPSFENYYQSGLLEIKLHKFALPNKLFHELKSYLESCRQYLQSEKKIICDAMFAKLKVAGELREIHCEDVNYYIASTLEKLEIGFDKNLPERQKKFTQHHFVEFHRFILKHGDEKQKNRLRTLPWFTENSKFGTQVIHGKLLIIPRNLIKPDENLDEFNWLKWFWSRWDPRPKFLKDKFYLLVNIRLSQHKINCSQTLLELIKGESWRKLNIFQTTLLQEAEDIRKTRSPWSRVFRPSLNRFYQGWSCTIQEALAKVLQDKIHHAYLISEQLRTRMVFNLDSDFINSETLLNFVKTMIDEIEQLKLKINDSSRFDLWEKSKTILDIFIASNRPKESLSTSSVTPGVSKDLQQNSHFVEPLVAIKNVCKNITSNNIFDLDLVSKKMSTLKFLFVLGQGEIKNDPLFWKNFFATYVASCVVLGSQNYSMKMMWSFVTRFGSKHVDTQANSFLNLPTQNSLEYHRKCQLLLNDLRQDTIHPGDRPSANPR